MPTSDPYSSLIAVVMITRNRRDEAARSLRSITSLNPGVKIIVVDNGSTDGTAAMLHRRFPAILVYEAGQNLAAAGRTAGVRLAQEPYIAFADDDSWWADGSLQTGVELFQRYGSLGLIQARVIVLPSERTDPNCELMANSLRVRHGAPGVPITGFLACAAMVRRDAYLSVGGFHARFGVGGEEALLAIDLLRSGWDVQYVDRLLAYHCPSILRHPGPRRQREYRNNLWTCWMRRRRTTVVRDTAGALRVMLQGDPDSRHGVLDAVRGGAWVVRERRPVPPFIEEMLLECERVQKSYARRVR
jgi:GT2 family glycosyltransferase